MAKIPLRTYGKTVESLIERGEIEQAIVHAKNILQTYPKHIDTYRLLGKAYLESQRYSEAADILQRVLSVYPDDFISHIGMSIIREDEGNKDAAIWHMERAYEVQPFNPAVQDELRRLYGTRDGVEPPRVRLTRGALVRMYGRGDLYPQAIAEAQAALIDEPQRQDLQVLLAQMYFQNGQRVEAAEVASSLLSKIPYCFEANRILAEVLPGSSRAEDARVFQQRIWALDPYQAFLSASTSAASQVPDQAVLVEEFVLGAAESALQAPDWTRSAGVAWEEEPEEELPTWLDTLGTPAAVSPQTATEAPAPEDAEAAPVEGEEDVIPEWMKAAGWDLTDGAAEEAPAAMEEDEAEDSATEAMPAEIPSWLQEAAPPAESLEVREEEQDRSGWLESILPGEGEDPAETARLADDTGWLSGLGAAPAAQEPPAEADLPEWMTDIAPGTPEAAGRAPSDEAGAYEEAVPDWLKSLENGPAVDEMPASEEGTITEEQTSSEEWTAGEVLPPSEITGTDLGRTQPVAIVRPASEVLPPSEITQPEGEATGAGDVDTPSVSPVTPSTGQTDYLKMQQQSEQAEAAAQADAPPDAPPDMTNLDAAMAWLESLAARQGADEATLITPPEQRTDTPPDWVQQEAAAAGVETAGSDMPSTVQPGEEAPLSPIAGDEMPEWLRAVTDESVEAETLAEEESAVGTPAVQTPGEDFEPEADLPAVGSVSTADETLAETTPAGEAPDLNDMDAAMAWLENLAARQGADEATLVTPPDQRTDTPPDWLQREVEASVEEAPSAAVESETAFEPFSFEQELAGKEDLPAWLHDTTFEEDGEAALPLETTESAMGTPAVQTPAVQTPAVQTPAVQTPAFEEPVMEEPALQTPSIQTPEVETPPGLVGEAQSEQAESEPAAMPDLNDMDAAMAWLESLAARQGADEATLITPADQRTDTPPEWVRDEISAQVAEPDTAGEDPFAQMPVVPAVETSAVETPEVETSAVQTPALEQQPANESAPDMSDMEKAIAWMESLAARQGADEATLVTPVEHRTEEPPDWLAQEIAAQVTEPDRAGQAPPAMADEPPPVTEESLPPALVQENTAADAVRDSDNASEWLDALGEGQEVAGEDVELPALTTDLQAGAPATTEPYGWVPEFSETTEAQPSADRSAGLPASEEGEVEDWLRELDDEAASAALPDYHPGEDQGLPSDWVPAEEIPAPLSESSAPPPAPTYMGEISSLTEAQTALMRGNLDAALRVYDQYIQEGQQLDTVIHDLRDALYRYPVDVSLWQALGDAFARNNQLQEALDAYTKAEELLR